ncbi:MAG: hypothetical protein RL417_1878 [Pseudomonadota bacterium]
MPESEVVEGEVVSAPDEATVPPELEADPPAEGEPEFEVLPAEFDDEEALPESGEQVEVGSSEDRGVVRYDALSAYLREIARYPALSREEERELAVRYFENKDLEAAYKLVSSNLWLVVKLARDYERAARNLLDLIQEGNVGLLEAVKNFDPYRNVRFPSYAVWWIKAYIIRYVIANWRLVKLGTTQAQRKLFFNLKKEKERLEREGFYPGPKLLAEKLNVKESEVVEMEQRLGGGDVSVDAPLQEDGEGTLLSILPSGERSAEDLLAQKELRGLILRAIHEFGSTLNEKEEIIFRERMLGEEKATLQDIAEKLSLSRERIRQLENRIREKLKSYLIERFGSAIQDTEFEL